MESNSHLEDVIYEAIDRQDESAIPNLVNDNRNPNTVFKILKTFFRELELQAPQYIKQFCLSTVQDIIEAYQIPIVKWLNSSHSLVILERLLGDYNLQDSVCKILELCLEIFSFDKNRELISNIANVWKDAYPRRAFPHWNKEMSAFDCFYVRKQNVIKDSRSLDELSSSRKRELPSLIIEFLDTEDFEHPDFNFLEVDQAIIYYNELVEILNSLDDLDEEEQQSSEDEEEILWNHVNHMHVSYPKETRLRTSFILHERLEESEGIEIEYKNYSWEFDDRIDTIISKTVCGFLNRYGGRMYIGIDDNGSVIGIRLTAKQRDQAKLHILGLMNAFEPSNINTSHLVDIVYLPIMNPKDYRKIPGLFVMKIIVKQGDVTEPYSTSKDSCQFYQRNDAQTVLLKTRQVRDLLTTSSRTRKQKHERDFIDPKPENLVDLPLIEGNRVRGRNPKQSKKSFTLRQRSSGRGKGILRKAEGPPVQRIIQVWIKGLPIDAPVDMVERSLGRGKFEPCVTERRVFHKSGITTSGEGLVNFNNEVAAKDYVNYLNSTGLCAFIRKFNR